MPTQISCNLVIPRGIFGIPPPNHTLNPETRPDFAFKSRIPSFKWGKSRIPRNLLGTLPSDLNHGPYKQSSNLVPRILSYPSLRSKRTWERGWQSPTLDFFLFFNLFQLSTQVSSISQLPEWSCFLFCAIRLLLCVCFLTCLCRLIRKCDMTLKWTLIALKTVNQHNIKMIQQALNKMNVFANFRFWLLALRRPLFLKTECFQKPSFVQTSLFDKC